MVNLGAFRTLSDSDFLVLQGINTASMLGGHIAVTSAQIIGTWDEVAIKKSNLDYKEVDMVQITPPK